MEIDFNQIIAFERSMIHYQQDALTPASGIRIRVGKQPILFTAPHSARHKRDGRWKQEDEYTAAIADYLHRTTHAHAIYLTHQLDPDPHDDGADNLFKQTIATFLRENPVALLIDLHGVRGDRDFGVALGTMNGISCPAEEPVLIDCFQKTGFSFDKTIVSLDRLVLNHPYYTGGLTRPTITRFVSENFQLPAAQIEINGWLRILQRLPTSSNALNNTAPHFRCDYGRFERVISALVGIVDYIASRKPQGA